MSSPAYVLGINTCFAVKRWPEPERWAEIVCGTLGLDFVQHSLDLVDLDAGAPLQAQADAVNAACERHRLAVHSTFTGLGAYGRNMLLAPGEDDRRRALEWFVRAVDFTAMLGATATGGHIGAYSVADYLGALPLPESCGDRSPSRRFMRTTEVSRSS